MLRRLRAAREHRPPGPSEPRSRRRVVLLAGGATLGLLLLGAVWILITGLLARARLDAAKADLTRLRHAVLTGDVAGAERIGRHLQEQAAGAHALTSGPAWWVASGVPVLGSPVRTTRVITAETDRVGAHALPGALQVAVDLAAQPRVGALDLHRIAAAAPALHLAAETTRRARRHLTATGGSWLPYVSSARHTLLGRLTSLDADLESADRALQIVLPMLGEQRPQRIFIGFLNEAEARPLGGIPGQYAVATANHGHLRFERFGADDDLRGVRAGVDLGADFTAQFAQDDPTGVLQNSTVSPDFRDAARIWAGMWEAKTGERVDAAVAVDPTTLGRLLEVVGPARLPDGTRVSGRQIVSLTERDVYVRFPDKKVRKAYLSTVARAAADQLLTAKRPASLARAAGRAVRDHRLMAWSADPAVESALLGLGAAGAMPDRDAPAAGFVVTNTAGSKLDYYLDRVMSYHRAGCGRGARAEATLRVSNRAPARLPAYVTIRADDHRSHANPGDNRMLITYYGSAGAQISAATLDGRPVAVTSSTLRGLTTVSVDVELPRGATRTLALTVREPAASAPLQVIRQPLVRPLRVEVSGADC